MHDEEEERRENKTRKIEEKKSGPHENTGTFINRKPLPPQI
jgi:hypothetical protein